MFIELTQLSSCVELKGASRFVMHYRTSGSPSCWTDWYEDSTKDPEEFINMVNSFITKEEEYHTLQGNIPGYGMYDLKLEVIF